MKKYLRLFGKINLLLLVGLVRGMEMEEIKQANQEVVEQKKGYMRVQRMEDNSQIAIEEPRKIEAQNIDEFRKAVGTFRENDKFCKSTYLLKSSRCCVAHVFYSHAIKYTRVG